MICEFIFAIYLIGCILCYARLMGGLYEIDEKYPMLEPQRLLPFEWLMIPFSWLGFLAGIGVYFSRKERYFFKWSKQKLWEQYRTRFPAEPNKEEQK